jgi:uncharacterized membrane protein
MSHNLVLVTWDESSKAFESFNQLKNSSVHKIHEISLLKRQNDGRFKIEDQINPDQDNGIWSGSLIGALVGVLGGPFGIILGFAAGALIGESYDINNEKSDLAVLGKISQALPIGTVGILIDAFEESESYLDSFFEASEVTIYRWDYDEVQAEIEASVDAWNETQRIANLTLKEHKKAEHKAKRQAKWDAFKAHFSKHH